MTPRLPSSIFLWLFMLATAWCALAQAGDAHTRIKDPDQFLRQTESVRKKDHPQFVQRLAQIHRDEAQLTSDERWHLRYLDAWETMYEGANAESRRQLQDVIAHSRNDTLIYKASGLLLSNLTIDQRYTEAFALANQLTTDLPLIRDKAARFQVLSNLSQMLNFAGQIDLSIKYAHMMEYDRPVGETLCYPLYLETAALSNGKRLTSSSPELQKAIDTCVAAGQPIIANAAWLNVGYLYLREKQPRKTMRLLDRIGPSLDTSHYQPHLFSAQVMKAQAYAMLGHDGDARKAALAAVAMTRPGEVDRWLKVAYEVLYRIEKKRGNAVAALSYYENYVTQDKGYLNDISARTIAFQTVQQQVLTKKLETEELSKQNNILRLQQALDTKAVETSRLYITLLLMTIASIVFWLYRLKRSQMRFKSLSHRDGLTGIFNHQHFINEAERVLHVLERRHDSACMVSIDLDHFKQVNDNHGHAIGDAVLRHTVALCQHHLRPADVFGRLGGEEFCILLHLCSRTQGMEIANRIRIAIGATPLKEGGSVVSISASFGLAATDASGYDLLQLCSEADAALYRAKRGGRNRVIDHAESRHLGEPPEPEKPEAPLPDETRQQATTS
jgi:diguanylate cyclase (GGDEF)-like protein